MPRVHFRELEFSRSPQPERDKSDLHDAHSPSASGTRNAGSTQHTRQHSPPIRYPSVDKQNPTTHSAPSAVTQSPRASDSNPRMPAYAGGDQQEHPRSGCARPHLAQREVRSGRGREKSAEARRGTPAAHRLVQHFILCSLRRDRFRHRHPLELAAGDFTVATVAVHGR